MVPQPLECTLRAENSLNHSISLQTNQETQGRSFDTLTVCAMLELSCSLYTGDGATSLLLQAPFGYINDTYLVGVADQYNNPILVNNPFFGTDRSLSHLGINNALRRPFSCQVYNDHSRPFVLASDGIYDGLWWSASGQ